MPTKYGSIWRVLWTRIAPQFENLQDSSNSNTTKAIFEIFFDSHGFLASQFNNSDPIP